MPSLVQPLKWFDVNDLNIMDYANYGFTLWSIALESRARKCLTSKTENRFFWRQTGFSQCWRFWDSCTLRFCLPTVMASWQRYILKLPVATDQASRASNFPPLRCKWKRNFRPIPAQIRLSSDVSAYINIRVSRGMQRALRTAWLTWKLRYDCTSEGRIRSARQRGAALRRPSGQQPRQKPAANCHASCTFRLLPTNNVSPFFVA